MSTQVFTLPDLGEGLTEAELVRWLVAAGDTIAVDAPIAEVETAKSMVEVPSPFGGVVRTLHGAEGSSIAVGAPLISVDDLAPAGPPAVDPTVGLTVGLTGSPAAPSAAARPDDPATAAYREEERAGSGNVLIGYGTSAAAPTRRRRGARSPVSTPATSTTPASASGRPGTHQSPRPAVQSPIVRQLARLRGMDLTALVGTGPGGLITRRDVETATPAPPTATTASAAATPGRGPAPAGPADGASSDGAATDSASSHCASSHGAATDSAAPAPRATPGSDRRTGLPIRDRVPLRGMRKAIAATLSRSRTEIPEATTWVDVDATELIELRAAWAEKGSAPSILAMIARFVVAGLARFPELNARVDTEAGEIQLLDGVNLGIAAQTDRGLVVPAVRDAHRLGMRGLHAEIKRLTAAARQGQASVAELSTGSFTLNNYGVLGVDGSVAIINHPEVAILGVGRIIPRPWVVDGRLAVRQIGQLSLVFDHRVCDGGTAGGFLRFVADAVEHPTAALAEL